jgi:hypothetical protein
LEHHWRIEMQKPNAILVAEGLGKLVTALQKKQDADMYAQRRIRHGKTAKDHARGSKKNAQANRDARNEWCQSAKATAATHPSGSK